MINFELIRSGRRFPYDGLRRFDAVFYSPIEAKADYNTTNLADACRALGVEAVCFPWLEWHGYCPGASKGEFKHRFQWRYLGLAEAASGFPTFQQFMDWAIEAFPCDATIDASFSRTTAMLRDAEARHAMPVRISDFILDRHRHSRLFLVSDHPSLSLYLHVLGQMLAAMGIADGGRCAAIARHGAEPQWRWRTPIFPRVAKRLDLRFADATWVDDEMVPDKRLDLRSYLKLYYYAGSLVIGPVGADAGQASPSQAGEDDAQQSTRLIADLLEEHADGTGRDYRLLEVLSGAYAPAASDGRFTVDTRTWRSSWG